MIWIFRFICIVTTASTWLKSETHEVDRHRQTNEHTHTQTDNDDDVMMMMGNAGILQLCNTARHNVVIIYVPIYHAFYYLMHI